MGDSVLPCGPEAAGMARRLVADACVTAGLPAEVCDSAQLCTSELVTNAIVHGRSEVRLHVSTTGGPAPQAVPAAPPIQAIPVQIRHVAPAPAPAAPLPSAPIETDRLLE